MSKPVLIVGAGPTGLVMACRLSQLGISVRIVDALPQPSPHSRAFTIHARTLEQLGQLGLEDAFLTQALRTNSMDYHFPGLDYTPRLDFTVLDSCFAFCLTINQADTELILRNRLLSLGVQVEWNIKLTAFAQDEHGALTATLQHLADDTFETVEPDWLIGCDGYFSQVRRGLALDFEGEKYEGTMRMMDVEVSGYEYSSDAIHYHIAKDHMLLLTKLPGKNHRVLISDKTEGVPADQARAAFQDVLNQHFGGKVTINEPLWATNFHLARRQVQSYRTGRIFLAGDAAHVNSPAGGQGMNVAMQDAFNLSWKLAQVIKGQAPETLLDSYQAECAPVAGLMIEGTQYMHSIIMAHGQGMQERIELMRGGEWNKRAVSQVAGITYTYRTKDKPATESSTALAVGDRAPDAYISETKRIYHLVQPDGYTLFCFLGDSGATDALPALTQALAGRYKAPLTLWLIVPPAFDITTLNADLRDRAVFDSGDFYARYPHSLYLIRSDYYLAHIGSLSEQAALLTCLDAVLL